jgi:flagellar biosynthetic protein FliP
VKFAARAGVLGILAAGIFAGVSTAATTHATAGQSKVLSEPLRLALTFTALALLPAVAMSLTPFLRIITVLHFLRQALGTQSTPSNQILVGLALFLSFVVMQPVVMDIYHSAWEPLNQGQLSAEEAISRTEAPLKTFLLHFARERDLQLFLEISKKPAPASASQLDFSVVAPAYILSELKVGFQIGAMLYLPFLVIDLVAASITLSVGMVQLPPVMLSAPLKLFLFVMVDGWNVIIGSLVKGLYPH